MKTIPIAALCLLLASCSPRDFLSRRLAGDLIVASDNFKAPQYFVLQTGVVSSAESTSADYLVLQHHGWISATAAKCPPTLAPPPCSEILLTPSGVDTVHTLAPNIDPSKTSISIPVVRRELVRVAGISKRGNVADVDFVWKWVALNEVGAALYATDARYVSTVGFREYDDGWRVMQTNPRAGQSLNAALDSAEPSK